jgi:cyanuric acid amidohydrolase
VQVAIHKVAMAAPDDTSGLVSLVASGAVVPDEIVAVIGKTEGNGGANDFTRALATLTFATALADPLGLTAAEVAKRVVFIWSGGTEGVLSPHATIVTRRATKSGQPGGRAGLVVGTAVTPVVLPEEIGALPQVTAIASAVRQAMADAGITDPRDVHYVQVKGPMLTPARLAEAERRGVVIPVADTNASKPRARAALALGVAIGLGEVAADAVVAATINADFSLFSEVASTSVGGEVECGEVVLFGNSTAASGDLRIAHDVLDDVVDIAAVQRVLVKAADGMDHTPVALFAKAEPASRVRGRRTTMLTDADFGAERHARAVLSGIITAAMGDSAAFISGGSEHQCPPGKAPLAAIVRLLSKVT